jgi:hypothetical protein
MVKNLHPAHSRKSPRPASIVRVPPSPLRDAFGPLADFRTEDIRIAPPTSKSQKRRAVASMRVYLSGFAFESSVLPDGTVTMPRSLVCPDTRLALAAAIRWFVREELSYRWTITEEAFRARTISKSGAR